ncbi:hypothetical protein BDV09DRAFT_188940 [Aspergillus tetrazonus]
MPLEIFENETPFERRTRLIRQFLQLGSQGREPTTPNSDPNKEKAARLPPKSTQSSSYSAPSISSPMHTTQAH